MRFSSVAALTYARVNMAEVSERTLQLAVVLSFTSGVIIGWQANILRRRFLDWRKRRLQSKLVETQKKLDLA
ncbi:mitoregulin [Chiloscyllium punctatum]|uniref:mitoregulin n=2 Tax=Galeoidea TaxID=119195 RepID=UPI003B641CA4